MKTYLGLICAVVMLLAPTFGLTETLTTPAISVDANVEEMLDLTVDIYRCKDSLQIPWNGTRVTSMNFGNLTDALANGNNAGCLFSRTWFCAFLVAKTSGRQYTITQQADRLTNGAVAIPDTAYLLTPDYAAQDEFVWGDGPNDRVAQGAMPTGATLGAAGTAVGTKTIYTSEAQGQSRIIRAIYSITNGFDVNGDPVDGFSGNSKDLVPLTQAAGPYSGNVTFSLTVQ